MVENKRDENQRNEYIKTKLEEKGIDKETQDSVIKYVDMNKSLFGDFLDIDKVTDRIVNNLNSSISTYDVKSNPPKGLKKLFSSRGFWNAYEHKVEINPIHKLLSRFSKSEKQHLDSTIMHELDHCATTEYMDLPNYFNMTKEEFDETVKREGLEEMVEEIQDKQDGKLAASGVSKTSFGLEKNGDKLKHSSLTMFNEGITAYKQGLYDKASGIDAKTNYQVPKMCAEMVAETIGQENLIKMHFENDYEGIKTLFQEKTGKNLDELVGQLEPSSIIKSKVFGKLYTKIWEKKIENFNGNSEKPKEEKNHAWDLKNWGIDKEQFADKTEKVVKEFKTRQQTQGINNHEKNNDVNEYTH